MVDIAVTFELTTMSGWKLKKLLILTEVLKVIELLQVWI